MRERILKFIDISGLTAAKFADDIGVQRSSVSHILSGRNNPSFDFIQKILLKYKQVNAEWLLLGNGDMFKVARQTVLFDLPQTEINIPDIQSPKSQILESEQPIVRENSPESPLNTDSILNNTPLENPVKTIEKIMVFYDDKTFSVYTPEK
jgi:transcriptional regulator with XRE-family HTH domain